MRERESSSFLFDIRTRTVQQIGLLIDSRLMKEHFLALASLPSYCSFERVIYHVVRHSELFPALEECARPSLRLLPLSRHWDRAEPVWLVQWSGYVVHQH